MMIKNLVFFNHQNNGDIHVSRNFVKYIVDNIKSENYIYSHKNSDRLLLDIHKLRIVPNLLNSLDKELDIVTYSDEIYINTQYGAKNFKYFKGANMDTLYNLFNKYFEILNITPKQKIDFLPVIDYRYYFLDSINDFLKNNDKKKKVFISNGAFYSGQSANFDFDEIILKLANDFKDVLFIVSNNTCVISDNVIESKNITKINNDLNENSYISNFCDIIIGRNSGPYTYTLTKSNLYDINKKYIVLINNEADCYFDKNTKSKIIQSNNYNIDCVYRLIKNEIKK